VCAPKKKRKKIGETKTNNKKKPKKKKLFLTFFPSTYKKTLDSLFLKPSQAPTIQEK
jgi:hypothetical protein